MRPLRPERPNHVWSCDFVQDRTHDGRVYRTLNIIDEFRRRRPLSAMQASPAGQRDDTCQTKPQFRRRGRHLDRPVHPARTAGIHKIRQWRGFYREEGASLDRAVGAKTAFIAPGSPWENGYCASFNARFRDELLNGEAFYSLRRGPNPHREMASPLQYRSGRTAHWDTVHQRPKASYQSTGRDRPCINIQTGPLNGGRPGGRSCRKRNPKRHDARVEGRWRDTRARHMKLIGAQIFRSGRIG